MSTLIPETFHSFNSNHFAHQPSFPFDYADLLAVKFVNHLLLSRAERIRTTAKIVCSGDFVVARVFGVPLYLDCSV